MRGSGRNVLRSSTGRDGLTFPPAVADADALRARLQETDLFGSASDEATAYLANSLERFRITMALLPPLPAAAEALELGANPYFLTRLLREHGLSVTCANWFGDHWPDKGLSRQVVTESGTPTTYEFAHFNMECEPFPFEDDRFDLVLFCEILEHLPVDPIHPLVEIHRVLKPGGHLLVTTPNAVRWENVRRILQGDNVYETLSGYGVYGRHNREYTKAEVEELLAGCGFEVVTSLDADIVNYDEPVRLRGPVPLASEARKENLFVLARATGRRRWRYPRWLFSSPQALHRCVLPDLEVGVNCDLQSKGLYDLERFAEGRYGRWTGERPSSIVLAADRAGVHEIVVEGLAPPPAVGDHLVLNLSVGEAAVSWTVPCSDGAFRFSGELELPAGAFQASLWTDATWRPVDLLGTPDARRLGVVLCAVRVGRPASTGGRGVAPSSS